MLKSEIVNEIINQIEEVESIKIVKIYGLSNGVGYDLNVFVRLNNGGIRWLTAHALRTGWTYPKHLRPNNPYYKYSGSNDVYQSRVIDYWKRENKEALHEYYNSFKKSELIEILEELKNE